MLKAIFLGLRPKQWVKNLFIFLPLIFGKKLFVFPANLDTLWAGFLFSIGTGAVYLVNDIIDLEFDQAHPVKRSRTLASGKLNLRQAKISAGILFFLCAIFSLILNTPFGITVIVYFIFNFLYSKIFKDIYIVDIFCIALFLLLRIIAGGFVAGVYLSGWIILLAVLLAVFLGLNKRRQEAKLLSVRLYPCRKVMLKYKLPFLDRMVTAVALLIFIAYLLYTLDSRTVALFGSPKLLYSLPFVYYGIFRYLNLIRKANSDGDPTRIILTDRLLQLTVFCWVIVCVAVIYK